MKKTMAMFAYSILSLTLNVTSLSVADAMISETDIFLKTDIFSWKEYDNTGELLLEESGPIFGIGSATKFDFDPMTLKLGAVMYGGMVDYDGQTQAGAPVETRTDYMGVKFGIDFGWKFMLAEMTSFESFVGPAANCWGRDIRSTDNAAGYFERWWSIYTRLGLRGDHAFPGKLGIFAEGGIKLPVYNENRVDWRSFGWGRITVKPGRKETFFAEAGFRWENLKAALFYENMKFPKSAPVKKYVSGRTLTVWQPRSEADIIGMNIGLVF